MKRRVNSFEMTRTKTIIVFLLLIVISIPGFSQPGKGKGKKERIEEITSRRIAFITERVSLTPDEARVFWPLYNEYNQRRDDLMNEQHLFSGEKKNVVEMSRNEASQFAEREISRLEESAAIKREFHENLKQILSIEKIARLYEAERDFNRMIFREVRQRRGPPDND